MSFGNAIVQYSFFHNNSGNTTGWWRWLCWWWCNHMVTQPYAWIRSCTDASEFVGIRMIIILLGFAGTSPSTCWARVQLMWLEWWGKEALGGNVFWSGNKILFSRYIPTPRGRWTFEPIWSGPHHVLLDSTNQLFGCEIISRRLCSFFWRIVVEKCGTVGGLAFKSVSLNRARSLS